MKGTTGAQGKNNEPQRRRRKTIEYIKPDAHLDKNKNKSIRIKKKHFHPENLINIEKRGRRNP